ncbi:MAG: 1-acyl-sn-glycerol-3-phosphate acyltransferase [Phycisphaeraceae bacterium]|nr:1-acyl-sn-glycerol-3-phosphate acyltransferase [Phycisphaeraceae bacterium]
MFARLRARRPGTTLGNLFVYETMRRLLSLIIRVLYRPVVQEVGRVPLTGPVLLAANHQSFLDPPVIGFAVRERHLDYVARAGLFASPVFGGLIRALNAIPISEEGADAAAIREILRRLEAGRAVLIFPEGSRTADGAMHEFKRGVAVLVRRSSCPVMPVAIEGVYDTWPRSARWPRLFGCRVAVHYGEPIPHDELLQDGPDAALDRLRREIDSMRLNLRSELRRQTGGRFPLPGPGDESVS